MLVALNIRDLVLIERLTLHFEPHLVVLTGETGAGKSILLDALGLALGARAERSLVRAGAERAQVTATFTPPDGHPLFALLQEADLEVQEGDDVVLRRSVSADGKARAFINDVPVSATLLRQVGRTLVELHGQHDQYGLFDRTVQRDLIDAYGRHDALRVRVASCFEALSKARDACDAYGAKIEAARQEEDLLRGRLRDLIDLGPQSGEEATLVADRARLQAHDKLISGLEEAMTSLAGPTGALADLATVARAVERLQVIDPELIEAAAAAVERGRLELADAEAELNAAINRLADAEGNLESVEERLFALRDAGRKYQVAVDELPALMTSTEEALEGLEAGADRLGQLDAEVERSQAAFAEAVLALRTARTAAGNDLVAAVMAELPPLKLERVCFTVEVTPLDESDWTGNGGERVEFLIATNPGQPAGSLGKIASGGELSRIMLALKVVLARLGEAPTLIFDEIDSGIGGATADAVGERLARLGAERQVLVVTHAPQVAARAGYHIRVEKQARGEGIAVEAEALEGPKRRDEIARMLAGAKITDAARAAADSLLLADAPA